LFGVKAFELVLEGKFGHMVTYKNNEICDTNLTEAVKAYNFVDPNSFMVRAAKSMGMSFGD
jgi:6-phosphofructokinase 1